MIHIGRAMRKPPYIILFPGIHYEEPFEDIAEAIYCQAIDEAPYFYSWEMMWLRGKRRVSQALKHALHRRHHR